LADRCAIESVPVPTGRSLEPDIDMMRKAALPILGLLMAGLVAGCAAPKGGVSGANDRNNDPAGTRLFAYAGNLPTCSDSSVLGSVTSEFASRESTYWNSGLSVTGYDRIKETALRPWGQNFIPRRFCTARAIMSDGKTRQVSYSVRDRLGFATITWDVDWCITGLDRHKGYAPECTMARP
jgi:hypothetical protein